MTFSGQSGNRSPVLIKGHVVDEIYNPVSYVHILNKSRFTGTTGDYRENIRSRHFRRYAELLCSFLQKNQLHCPW